VRLAFIGKSVFGRFRVFFQSIKNPPLILTKVQKIYFITTYQKEVSLS